MNNKTGVPQTLSTTGMRWLEPFVQEIFDGNTHHEDVKTVLREQATNIERETIPNHDSDEKWYADLRWVIYFLRDRTLILSADDSDSEQWVPGPNFKTFAKMLFDGTLPEAYWNLSLDDFEALMIANGGVKVTPASKNLTETVKLKHKLAKMTKKERQIYEIKKKNESKNKVGQSVFS